MLDSEIPLVASVESLDNLNLTRRVPIGGEMGVWLGHDAQRALRAGRTRALEAMAEFVRRGRAPDKPSRLAAVYAYRDMNAVDVSATATDVPTRRSGVPSRQPAPRSMTGTQGGWRCPTARPVSFRG